MSMYSIRGSQESILFANDNIWQAEQRNDQFFLLDYENMSFRVLWLLFWRGEETKNDYNGSIHHYFFIYQLYLELVNDFKW